MIRKNVGGEYILYAETRSEAIQMIKRARKIMAYIPLSADDGDYFAIAKKQAIIESLREDAETEMWDYSYISSPESNREVTYIN